jgi:hypothetical protein
MGKRGNIEQARANALACSKKEILFPAGRDIEMGRCGYINVLKSDSIRWI